MRYLCPVCLRESLEEPPYKDRNLHITNMELDPTKYVQYAVFNLDWMIFQTLILIWHVGDCIGNISMWI